MTGPEHYLAAQGWLRDSTQPLGSERRAQQLAVAQIHATLALAAATAMSHHGDMRIPDDDAWRDAAATQQVATHEGES